MRIGSLGACLALSVLLNLVGFAPLMNFLLGRGGASRPAPRPPVQVRLLNAKMEAAKPVSPVAPPPPEEKRPEPVRPEPKTKVAALPKDVKPVPSDLPEDVTPQAKPQSKPQPKAAKPAQSTPSGPLTRPDEKSSPILPPPNTGNAAPFSAPGNATTPVPGPTGTPGEAPPVETPTPGPSSTPTPTPGPLADSHNNPLPSQTPSSPGTNPNEGVVPDKPAYNTTNPPKQYSLKVSRRLGGQFKVQVGLKIFPDGHTEARIVLSTGNSELDEAVLKDMRDWKWVPAEAAGKPVMSERLIRLKLES